MLINMGDINYYCVRYFSLFHIFIFFFSFTTIAQSGPHMYGKFKPFDMQDGMRLKCVDKDFLKSTTEHRRENKHKDAEMWHGGHIWWVYTGSSLIQHVIMDQITSSPPQQSLHTCAAPVAPPTAAKTTTFLLQRHKHSPHTCRWAHFQKKNLSMSVGSPLHQPPWWRSHRFKRHL